ncbi:MAG: O-antigen ligase family protein [Planctomycetales bacterium]|nr:O-antigen ligase family protein [Planctomycetales bacterium]
MTSNRSIAVTAWVLVAVAFALIPIAISFDYGGVLAWTRYIGGLAILATTIVMCVVIALTQSRKSWLKVASRLNAERPGNLRGARVHFLWIVFLALWAGFLYLQTAKLPAGMVARFSPGSSSAYTDWIAPVLEIAGQSPIESHAISIYTSGTVAVFAFAVTLIPLAWITIELAQHQKLVVTILLVTTLGTTAHALYGLALLTSPSGALLSDLGSANGFGGFVNRNNAALFLNIGLASSSGLAFWWLSSVDGMPVLRGSITGDDILEFLQDKRGILITTCMAILWLGIVSNGSRGGLLSAMLASMVVVWFGFHSSRVALAYCLAILVVIGAIAILVGPDLDLESITRLTDSEVNQGHSSLWASGRLGHWQDALAAAVGYFPMGCGVGAYGWAYLPFQEHGSSRWYEHADNLWIELVVEQGIFGIAFLIGLGVFTARAIHQLSKSGSPFDRAIRCSGLFLISAMMVSQVTDFGAIIPANTYIGVILATIIVTRGVMAANDRSADSLVVGEPRENDRKPSLSYLPSIKGSLGRSGFGLGLGGCMACLALPILFHRAESDSVAMQADIVYEGVKLDSEALERIKGGIDLQLGRDATEDLYAQQFRYRYQIARLAEIIASNPQSDDDVRTAYEETQLATRGVAVGTTTIQESYRPALQSAISAILANPLSIEARGQILYLEFVHGKHDLAIEVLKQLAVLQSRNPDQILRLAELARARGGTDLVQSLCLTATEIFPPCTPAALEIALSDESVDLNVAISKDSKSRRIASTQLLNAYSAYPSRQADIRAFLNYSVDHLECESCTGRVETAGCERLAGAICFLDKRYEAGLQHFRQAQLVDPANVAIRVDYINRLIEAGDLEGARTQIQDSLRQFPDDASLRQLSRQFSGQQ